MLLGTIFSVVAAAGFAAFRVALPAPSLPQASVLAPQVRAAALLPAVAPVPNLLPGVAAVLPTPAVLQAVAAPVVRVAAPVVAVAAPVVRTVAPVVTVALPAQAQAARLPEAARAAAPALAGKASWEGLFDGMAGAARNGVVDAGRTPLVDSWEGTHRLYTESIYLHDELTAIHRAERAGADGLVGRKRGLQARLKSVDERLNGALEADFPKASARLREAREARIGARLTLYAAIREKAGRDAVAQASAEVREKEAQAAAAGLRTARLILDGVARLHSKEARRNAAIKTLSGVASAALALHTEVAYGGARTLRTAVSGPVEIPVRRWKNVPALTDAPAEKVSVAAVATYPDLPTAVRAQEHQVRSMDTEAESLGRRSSEVSFWVELLQEAGAQGDDHRPLNPSETAAFASFIEDSQAWAGRGSVPAKRETARRVAEAGEAAAQGSFAVAAASLEAARNALDRRAAEVERMRTAVERRAARLGSASQAQSASARHEVLIEAAARWRRFLKRPLDAARAADLAGEARNHREAYLAQDEPGLPGYRRAAKDLERLEAALTSLAATDARALVDRFEQNLIHRRSLRIEIVIRQGKEKGLNRSAVRFALPGTTLRTLLKRVGGIPEKPEVRVNGGDWTPYGRLNLRGKLADETVLEILLPAVPVR